MEGNENFRGFHHNFSGGNVLRIACNIRLYFLQQLRVWLLVLAFQVVKRQRWL